MMICSYRGEAVRADMHIHTCASDGTWDVYDLKRELKKRGIGFFAITDHDSMSSVRPMFDAIAGDNSLFMISGVELTATYEGREYHLTAYGYDLDDRGLADLTGWCRKTRLDFNRSYMEEYMVVKYPQISMEDYDGYEYDPRRGGWKSLNYMIDRGIHKDIAEHFADIRESKMTVTFKTPEEVISIAKMSGAKIFLAHPSYHYRGGIMPKKELRYWTEAGIDGIECYSPYNGAYSGNYVEYCLRYGLLISGGSDCHGGFTLSRELGEPFITTENLSLGDIIQGVNHDFQA